MKTDKQNMLKSLTNYKDVCCKLCSELMNYFVISQKFCNFPNKPAEYLKENPTSFTDWSLLNTTVM